VITIADDIEIVVLAHDCKPAVTAEMLGNAGFQYSIYENPDWEWPKEHPELNENRKERPYVRGYALRQYRAFKGHQEILRAAKTEYTMVFEDDASFMDDTTIEEVALLINGVRRFITNYGYDAVSFHGRSMSTPRASVCLYGREFIELAAETVGPSTSMDRGSLLPPGASSILAQRHWAAMSNFFCSAKCVRAGCKFIRSSCSSIPGIANSFSKSLAWSNPDWISVIMCL